MSSPTPPSGRGPVWRRRVAALALGLLLVPVLLEVGLRVAALFVEGDRATQNAAPGSALVVCQGDSNTYGLHVEPSEAYPGALETLLREQGLADARVINRGVPGKPSWIVAEELEQDLALFSPRIVIVMVGVNDRNQLRPDGLLARVLGASRFASMVRRTLTNVSETAHASEHPIDSGVRGPEMPTFTMEFGSPDDESADRWTRESLLSIVERVRAAGSTPVLMTYFDSFSTMRSPSIVAMKVAKETGALLVNLRLELAPAFEQVGRDALEFPDAHLKPVGYRIVARVILNALVEAKLIAAEPVADVLAPLATIDTEEPRVLRWIEGGAVRGVSVQFKPGLRAQLLVSTDPGSTRVRCDGFVRSAALARTTATVPLYKSRTLSDSMREGLAYTIRLDETGAGNIALLPAADEAATLWGAVAFVDERDRIVKVSDALELR